MNNKYDVITRKWGDEGWFFDITDLHGTLHVRHEGPAFLLTGIAFGTGSESVEHSRFPAGALGGVFPALSSLHGAGTGGGAASAAGAVFGRFSGATIFSFSVDCFSGAPGARPGAGSSAVYIVTVCRW